MALSVTNPLMCLVGLCRTYRFCSQQHILTPFSSTPAPLRRLRQNATSASTSSLKPDITSTTVPPLKRLCRKRWVLSNAMRQLSRCWPHNVIEYTPRICLHLIWVTIFKLIQECEHLPPQEGASGEQTCKDMVNNNIDKIYSVRSITETWGLPLFETA